MRKVVITSASAPSYQFLEDQVVPPELAAEGVTAAGFREALEMTNKSVKQSMRTFYRHLKLSVLLIPIGLAQHPVCGYWESTN